MSTVKPIKRGIAQRVDTDIYPNVYVRNSDKMFFDGVNGMRVILELGSSASGYFGACVIRAKFFIEDKTTPANQVLWSHGSAGYRAILLSGLLSVNGTATGWSPNDQQEYEIVCTFGTGGVIEDVSIDGTSIWSGSEAAGNPGTGTELQVATRTNGLPLYGSIWDFSITGSAVKNLDWNGNGKLDYAWEDNLGSEDGTTIIPAGTRSTVGEYYLSK
mgnify:CR=1 FL=1